MCTKHGLLPVLFSHKVLSDSATPWTAAHQAPPSMGFPRQEYWSGLPFPSPWNLPNPAVELLALSSPSLGGRFFTTEPLGKPKYGLLSENNLASLCCYFSNVC